MSLFAEQNDPLYKAIRCGLIQVSALSYQKNKIKH